MAKVCSPTQQRWYNITVPSPIVPTGSFRVCLFGHPWVADLVQFSVPFFYTYCYQKNCHLTLRNNWAKVHSGRKEQRKMCVIIYVHFIAATRAEALLCSVFRSSDPSNSKDVSGISHVYVFFKGDDVRSSLPSRLAFLETDTLCHAKSLVPYVRPPFCWWQQLSYVPKVNYWLTGTKASTVTYWKATCQEWWFSNPNWGLFHMNFRIIWLPFYFSRKIFSFHTPLFSRNKSSRAAMQGWMLILVIANVLWAGYARNLVSKHPFNVLCLCKSH